MAVDMVSLAGNVIACRGLAGEQTPAMLMVSGGSDSTALAYIAYELRKRNVVGPLAMLHVNHKLRGDDADEDARFVARLAELLEIPLFSVEIEVGELAKAEGGNVEAIARRERYAAASEALASHCLHVGMPLSEGRIFTAHTADDRIENFYMRSIVGTGPGGFRSMKYLNGQVARPLLDATREGLRGYVRGRVEEGLPVARDEAGALWREDATNQHTDRFRAYVRHSIVPLAREKNPRLDETLTRTMNLIADEDDMLDSMAADLQERHVSWFERAEGAREGEQVACVLSPALGTVPLPLRRRVCMRVLQSLLGADARVETATVDALLAGYSEDGMNSGYVTNVQGNYAVSANKHGVRVEPMSMFRARRKRS